MPRLRGRCAVDRCLADASAEGSFRRLGLRTKAREFTVQYAHDRRQLQFLESFSVFPLRLSNPDADASDQGIPVAEGGASAMLLEPLK